MSKAGAVLTQPEPDRNIKIMMKRNLTNPEPPRTFSRGKRQRCPETHL